MATPGTTGNLTSIPAATAAQPHRMVRPEGVATPGSRAARQTRSSTPCTPSTQASNTASVVAMLASAVSRTEPSISRPASSAASAPVKAKAHQTVSQLATMAPKSDGSR